MPHYTIQVSIAMQDFRLNSQTKQE